MGYSLLTDPPTEKTPCTFGEGNTPKTLLSIELTWEKIDGDYPDLEDNINPFTQEVQGQRIFPGKKTPSDSRRNKVTLKVDVGIPNAQVYVKAFDVDDPTPVEFDKDNDDEAVIDPDDETTEGKGDDNREDHLNTVKTGFFTSSNTATANKQSDAEGIAEFEFNVGMQPGNNYRVVASVFNEDVYADVQVADPTASGYLGPDEDDTPSPASPLLTVWRKLHVEQDTMQQVPVTGSEKNFETGKIDSITSLGSGQFELNLDVSLSGGNNRYENGYIFIDGWRYDVVSNDNNTFGGDDVIIEDDSSGHMADLHASGVTGQAFQIFDDDDQNIPSDYELPLPSSVDLITDVVREKYRPAFIELDTTMPNATSLIPFILNKQPPHGTGRDIPDSNDFWACRVVAAYQPPTGDDNDPDDEDPTDGWYNNGDAFVYMEMIREDQKYLLESSNPVSQQAALDLMLEFRNALVAHEVGHGPKNDIPIPVWIGAPINAFESPDHAEWGLMASGLVQGRNQDFTAMTIYRFREAEKWND